MATDSQIPPSRMVAINPATGEMLVELACASTLEVERSVTLAREAQTAWAATGMERRLEVMQRFSHLLTERKVQIAKIITAETGKPYMEALLTEVLVVLDATQYLLGHSRGFLRDEPVPHGSFATKTKSGRLIREPYGVIGIISPWNFPFSIPATEALSALAVGNAVVLKPSELTPLSAIELASLLSEAGLPQNLFQVVQGDGRTGAALVEAPIGKLVFTGSVETGRRIAQVAAARLLPVVLELGGKDPMIVLEDANIDVASSGALWGAFVNAGQACLAVERCYVHRSIHNDFVKAAAEKTKRLRVGNGMNPEVDIGPLINQRQLRLVEQHIEDAVKRGAQLITGGKRLLDLGANFYAPTVLTHVNHEMRIMWEETFGPVLPVMAFDSEDEAIKLANDSKFGLAASVWTRDRKRGERIARQINAGSVMVNDAVSCFGISEAPHGGVKSSGIGRTHGRFGLEETVIVKYFDSDLLPGIKKPWWFGYASSAAGSAEAFLDFQFAKELRKRLNGAMRSAGLIGRTKI